MGKVFISHASRNFRAADDLRSRLEDLGIPCWIAPRDIPAGSSYGEVITGAMQNANAVILILTEEANLSRGVASELELAFRHQRIIIPVRLQPVEPANSLAFYVNNAQWVDACHTPLKHRVHEIAKILRAIADGSPPPLPSPEQWTFLGSVEKRIESLIRYKFLTLTTALVILICAGTAAVLISGQTLSRMESMTTEFEALRSAATIVSNPKRPEEFYSNAIQYEMRGDLSNARESYKRYFETGAQFIDPIDRYIKLITSTQGKTAAQEALHQISREKPSILLEAYIYSQESPSKAAALLSSLVHRNPDVGPLKFLLARQFGESRRGRQSLDDQKQEREALEAFLASHEKGEVAKYFIDGRVTSEWISNAEAILKKLAGIDSVSASLEVSPSESGWQLSLNANETVRRVFYRLSPEHPLVDLGQHREMDQDTHERMAKLFVEVPRRVNLNLVEFFYDDVSHTRRGPVKLSPGLTDPNTITARWHKDMLEATKSSWVSFRPDMPIAYFTHLASYRCAIREVKWGWGERLSQTLKLPPCDVNRPFDISQSDNFTVRFDPLMVPFNGISIQLTFVDGSKSETVAFEFPPGILETLRNESRESAKTAQENAEVAARFNRFYRLMEFRQAAWTYAFQSKDPYWTVNRLENIGRCLPSPVRITRPDLYKRIEKAAREEGEREARKQPSPEALSEFLTQTCEELRKAQKETEMVQNK